MKLVLFIKNLFSMNDADMVVINGGTIRRDSLDLLSFVGSNFVILIIIMPLVRQKARNPFLTFAASVSYSSYASPSTSFAKFFPTSSSFDRSITVTFTPSLLLLHPIDFNH